jgi:hypothetical protein
MSPRPDEQRQADPVRQGPLCGTCPSSVTGRACTDCTLRAGVHVQRFPTTALLPKEPPRWIIFAVLGSLVTLFVLGSLLTAVDRTVFGPANAVDSFFSALEERDADAVIAQADPALAFVSTAAMLGDPGYRPPSQWKASVVDGGFHAATVDVTYTVEGRTIQQELLLERVGYRGGLFSRWAVGGSMPTLDVIMPGSGLVVAGETFPADTDLRSAAVLPGSYLVQTTKNPLVTVKQQVVAVPADARTEPPVLAEISTGAVAKAKKAVKSLLAECAGSIEENPDGCPFRTPTSCGSDTPVSWTTGKAPVVDLVQRPDVAVADDPTPFSTVYLQSSEPGYMTYRRDCGFGAYPETVSFELSDWGLSASGNELVLVEPQLGD